MATSSRTPSERVMDARIGKLIRDHRKALGNSQTWLGDRAGKITFQQIQKYENGQNRISAARLFTIARALGVSVLDLYPKG
jgi:transcriptional regulator with XRE-family HTH domain